MPDQQPKPEYTPASPIKRTLAWMGVVYMVILVLLTTYNLATGAPLRANCFYRMEADGSLVFEKELAAPAR